jgi:cytochrome c556
MPAPTVAMRDDAACCKRRDDAGCAKAGAALRTTSETTTMQQTWRWVAGCALAAVVAAGAAGQGVRPDRAIKYRQGVMTAINWNLGVLAAMAKGDRPYDKDVALKSATFVEALSHMPWDGFVAGSDKGAPTKALPEVWKEPAKFKQHEDALMNVTPKLVIAAKTGELAALKAAVGEVGRACNDCHDDFREK